MHWRAAGPKSWDEKIDILHLPAVEREADCLPLGARPRLTLSIGAEVIGREGRLLALVLLRHTKVMTTCAESLDEKVALARPLCACTTRRSRSLYSQA